MFSKALAKAAGKGGQTRSVRDGKVIEDNEEESSAKYVAAEEPVVDPVFKKKSVEGDFV